MLLLMIGGSRIMANDFKLKETHARKEPSRNSFFILQILYPEFTGYKLPANFLLHVKPKHKRTFVNQYYVQEEYIFNYTHIK